MNTPILAKIVNGVGRLTLNSEKSLNALNQEMVEEIFNILHAWKSDKNVACVFMDAMGDKAFCAGGDVRRLHKALSGPQTEAISPECLKFFISEYTLDYEIHTYPKPIVVWATGITMGGGMGIMNGAGHRIVTETSKLAMPEITIGLYPDVGATWFYNKLPDGYGIFLGLTAARINAGDALELKLADFFATSDMREDIFKTLETISWSHDENTNHKFVSDKLRQKLSGLIPPKSLTSSHKDSLQKFARVDSVADFKKVLSEIPKDNWINESISIFEKGSPISAAVILEQFRRGKKMTLKEVFMSELNLSVHFSQRSDFPEGIRALLVDKDLSPKWNPATNESVTNELIQSYFIPIWKESDHPFIHWMER